MTTRPMPVLNRNVTLGMTGPSFTGPTKFAFNNRALNVGTAGSWFARKDTGQQDPFGNPIIEDVAANALATKWAGATLVKLRTTDANSQTYNPASIAANDTLYLYGPGDAFVSWKITAASVNDSVLSLTVTNGALSGQDWTVGTATLGFSSIVSTQAGSPQTRSVWARISERGAESGLLAVEADDQDIVIRESAEFMLRFIEPTEYSAITSVTDQYGRVWTVNSLRAVLDRRFLALEAYR